jgi:deoxyribodipyrimidine photo-lyase
MISPSRLRTLNGKPVDSSKPYVLYWLQQAQRVGFNQALAHAIDRANELKKPLVVGFGLMDDYPEATERHYAFMLDGLRDLKSAIEKLGATFVVKHGVPKDVAVLLAKDAACVVTDRAYLRHLVGWREHVANAVSVRVEQVETELVVPLEVASTKSEIGARTLRPKIHRAWAEHLVPVEMPKLAVKSAPGAKGLQSDFDVSDPDAVLKKISCIREVKRSPVFTGGERAAQKHLDDFIASQIDDYAKGRNEPARGQSSTLSPYLQYGHISPIDMATRVVSAKRGAQADRDSFVEELIVRRELAHNFTSYNAKYDRFAGLPEWAQKSLRAHAMDKRQYVYTRDELATGQTHDSYWNAAQMEMVLTGFMHNYMRMYWGKKILEWTPDPEEAHATTLWLNNRFFLDGLNANSYGNVAWIYGQHDRPWGPERPIFGLIRYMNAAGLERKFDIQDYVVKVDDLSRELTGSGIRSNVLF